MLEQKILNSLKIMVSYRLSAKDHLDQAELKELDETIQYFDSLLASSRKHAYAATDVAIEAFTEGMFERRLQTDYIGSYSLSMISEGLGCSFAVNDINCERIAEDELLIHINAVYAE